MTEEPKGHDELVNWAAALDAAGGDEVLLLDLAREVLNEAPMRLRDTRQAIDRSDAVLLRRSGHTLKSLLRIFDSPAARELAQQLEEKGKNSTFDDAPRVFAELEPMMGRIIDNVKARLGQ